LIAEGDPAFPAGGGRLLASVALAAALTPLNSTMIVVALRAIGAEFQAAPSTVTVWVVTAYLVATVVSQMPAGSVADRIGYGRTLAAGRWLFAAGTAAACLAPSLPLVVAGRLLMAAGGSLMVPTAMAMLRVATPPARRARAFGAMGAVMGGAATLGPALGTLVIASASWRVLFLVNIPLVAASWLLQPRGLAAPPETRARARFDALGSVLMGVSLALLVLATRLTGASAAAAAGVALALFAVLVRHERRTPAPVFDVTLFSVRPFVAGSAVIALQNLAMYALLIQIPFLFAGSSVKGDARLGLAVLAMTATMTVSSPVGGRLAERFGARLMVVCGGLLGCAGTVWLATLGPAASTMQIASRLVLVGLGLGASTGPAQAESLSAIARERSGMAAAAVSTLRYLGGILGTAILGIALGSGHASADRQQVVLVIFAAAFAASALCGLAFAPLALRSREVAGAGAG